MGTGRGAAGLAEGEKHCLSDPVIEDLLHLRMITFNHAEVVALLLDDGFCYGGVGQPSIHGDRPINEWHLGEQRQQGRDLIPTDRFPLRDDLATPVRHECNDLQGCETIPFTAPEHLAVGTDPATWLTKQVFKPGSETAIDLVGIEACQQVTYGVISGKMGAASAQWLPEHRPLLACPDPGTPERVAPV